MYCRHRQWKLSVGNNRQQESPGKWGGRNAQEIVYCRHGLQNLSGMWGVQHLGRWSPSSSCSEELLSCQVNAVYFHFEP